MSPPDPSSCRDTQSFRYRLYPGILPFFASLLVASATLLASSPAAAQNRPLRTSDAEIVPAGTLRAEVGFDFLQDVSFPLSGLSGDQTSLGVLEMRMGLGRMVEVQLEGAVQHFLDVKKLGPSSVSLSLTSPSSTHDVGDFSVFTKIRILREKGPRPAVAFRFGFVIPDSNQARGIGTNTTDIYASLILQKHFGRLDLLGNIGLGILQAPKANFSQNDVLTYGAAFEYAFHPRFSLVGEVAGRQSTRRINMGLLGTESRSQGRFGVQVLAGGLHWDFAGIAGVTPRDPKAGFTFGISRDFHLFDYGKR